MMDFKSYFFNDVPENNVSEESTYAHDKNDNIVTTKTQMISFLREKSQVLCDKNIIQLVIDLLHSGMKISEIKNIVDLSDDLVDDIIALFGERGDL